MVADMDGGGHPDIVTATAVLYGDGAYGFTPVSLPTAETGPYLVGDFNGDGKLDIAIAGSMLINAGNRSFNVVPESDLPLFFGSVGAVADFNGDGRADVAISASGEQTIEIYYGQADGTVSLGPILYSVNVPGGLAVGDFDGDGRMDLAAGLILAQQAVIFFNQGNGRFSQSFFASGADTTALTAYDLNHRGKSDLIFTNFPLDFRPPNVDVIFHK